MRIKKFWGENALEVIKEVKRELGEEALILSSGRVEKDGKLLYELTAAVDERKEEPMRPPSEGALEELKEEIKELKRLLQETFSFSRLKPYAWRWLEAGLPLSLAQEIEDPIKWVKTKLASWKESPLSRISILIGAPGAGKTSATFKIAAWLKYRCQQPVEVLSLDTKKIEAWSQAMRLGEWLEIPVRQDLSEVPSRSKWILVDTPSWGQFFREEDLGDLLSRLPQAQVQVVLKATENPRDLERFLKRLKGFPLGGLILTHVDWMSLGLNLGFLLQNGFPPVSFVSWGERVPEDLCRATPSVLERVFLRGLEEIYALK